MYQDTEADRRTMFIQCEDLKGRVVALTTIPVLSGWSQGAPGAQGHPWLCETLSLKATTTNPPKNPSKIFMSSLHEAELLSVWVREGPFHSRWQLCRDSQWVKGLRISGCCLLSPKWGEYAISSQVWGTLQKAVVAMGVEA